MNNVTQDVWRSEVRTKEETSPAQDAGTALCNELTR